MAVGILVGIAIAAVIYRVLWPMDASPFRRALLLGLMLAGGTLSAFVASSTANLLRLELRLRDETDLFFKSPFFRVIVRDHPKVYGKLLYVLRRGSQGSFHSFVGELKQAHAAERLLAAGPESGAAAWSAHVDFLKHVRSTDPPLCMESMADVIVAFYVLDPEGRRLFDRRLAAMEAMYEDGGGRTDPRRGSAARGRTEASGELLAARLGFRPDHRFDVCTVDLDALTEGLMTEADLGRRSAAIGSLLLDF